MVEAIVERLDKERYQPVVYCSSRVVPEGTNLPGVELIRMPTLPGKHLHALSLFLFSALHALLVGGYDLIHVHNVEACFVSPLLRLRYKVMATSHGRAQERDKWSRTAKLLIRLTEYPYDRFSNCITSVAGPLADYYEERFGKKVHYIPNGVEDEVRIDADGAQEVIAQQGLDGQEYVMFAAGRIIATKGCHLLLQSLDGLDKGMKVLIAGDASQVPSYEEELQRLADDRVRFCGFLNSKELLLGLVSRARLFVFPSTVEAMSMMLLEVASVGTPIISSDIPENTSVLPEQALFFESGNERDLQEKLEWALVHPEGMQQLAIDANAWVNKNYRWKPIVKEYERLYDTCAAQSRGASN